MLSTLMCMVTHYTGPMVRLSDSHDFTELLHCIVS